jgi:Fe-S-cluster containining protein
VSARAAELSALCRACGLCCDGSLFGIVPLRDEERAVARARGLPIVHERALEQPCGALSGAGEDRSCAIYAERPGACRAFRCRLHARHETEDRPLDERLAIVRRARQLLAAIDHAAPRDAQTAAAIDELAELIERDFGRA